MDYSICNAINFMTRGFEITTSTPQPVLLEYDIACSWSKNFLSRVTGSNHLQIPNVKIIPAVGKFHLGAHAAKCFSNFSLNFIHGAGQQDGEVLETLWPPINHISTSARLMSKSARREILDDIMRDSNFKKLVGIGLCLINSVFQIIGLIFSKVRLLLRKYERAVIGSNDLHQAFLGLDQNVTILQRQKWQDEYEMAQQHCGDWLNIYDVKICRGKNKVPCYCEQMNFCLGIAPTQAEIRLQLTRTENMAGGTDRHVMWLNQGINLEQSQLVSMTQWPRRK